MLSISDKKKRKEDRDYYNPMSNAIGNQAMLSNMGMGERTVQRKVLVKRANKVKDDELHDFYFSPTKEQLVDEILKIPFDNPAYFEHCYNYIIDLYNYMDQSDINYTFNSLNQFIDFLIGLSFNKEEYQLSDDELHDNLTKAFKEIHSTQLVNTMEQLLDKRYITYNKASAVVEANTPVPDNNTDLKSKFDNIYTNNPINKKSKKHYNCWSVVIKAAYNAGIYNKKDAVLANTRGDGNPELPLNLMRYANYKATENSMTDIKFKEFAKQLPGGTVISLEFEGDKSRDGHVFLAIGNGNFLQINFNTYNSTTLMGATIFEEIIQMYAPKCVLWYTHIDSLLLKQVPPPVVDN